MLLVNTALFRVCRIPYLPPVLRRVCGQLLLEPLHLSFVDEDLVAGEVDHGGGGGGGGAAVVVSGP